MELSNQEEINSLLSGIENQLIEVRRLLNEKPGDKKYQVFILETFPLSIFYSKDHTGKKQTIKMKTFDKERIATKINEIVMMLPPHLENQVEFYTDGWNLTERLSQEAYKYAEILEIKFFETIDPDQKKWLEEGEM